MDQARAITATFTLEPGALTVEPPDLVAASRLLGRIRGFGEGLEVGRVHAEDGDRLPGSGPACSVTTTVTARLVVRSSARRRTVKLGGRRFTVGAGKRARVKSKLSARGRRLLRKHGKLRIEVRIVARRTGKTTTETVTDTLKAPRRKSSRR